MKWSLTKFLVPHISKLKRSPTGHFKSLKIKISTIPLFNGKKENLKFFREVLYSNVWFWFNFISNFFQLYIYIYTLFKNIYKFILYKKRDNLLPTS